MSTLLRPIPAAALALLLPFAGSVRAVSDPMEGKCRDILEQGLGATNPDTRKQAVIAISLAGPRDPFLTRLVLMLKDKDVEVRLAAIASLSEVKSRTAVAGIRTALDDEVPEVSFAAAKALWALHDPAGKQTLLAVLEGESKTTSGFFSKQKRDAMRMTHTPRTMLLFAVRQGAAFVPFPGVGAGVTSMQALLTDPGVSGRATAALLLGNDPDAATLEALRDALNDKEWSVRAAAVHSIAMRNSPALKRDLTPLLDDKKEAVRMRAAAAILRLSPATGSGRTSSAPAPPRPVPTRP